jgi:hypothetical protein
MSEGIILGVAVAAGLACPAHMWWSHRRGRQAACCPPAREAEKTSELDALRARQERLSALIATHAATTAAAPETLSRAARD